MLINREAVRDSLRLHEGLRLKPYRCTAGALTIGFGRNLDDKGITKQEAEAMLEDDILDCIVELDRTQPGWRDLPIAARDVLVEMQFNLGANRLAGFRKMWAALRERDYQQAAAEMLDSRWANQVGRRAVTLANKMREAGRDEAGEG